MPEPSIAASIEATVLRPDATRADLELALSSAAAFGCGRLCIPPDRVAELRHGPLPLVTVVGFPFGYDDARVKAEAAARAVDAGAAEIDMVLALGRAKEGDWAAVGADVAGVRSATGTALLKVILETGLLSEEERDLAARVCVEAGADMLKTSTGHGPRGATVADVVALRRFGRVKASGGIRDRAQAVALLAAGAERLGTSAWEAILAPGGEA